MSGTNWVLKTGYYDYYHPLKGRCDTNVGMCDSEMKKNWKRCRAEDMKTCLNWVAGDPQRPLPSGYGKRGTFLPWEIKTISARLLGHSLRKWIEAGFGHGEHLCNAWIFPPDIIILHSLLKKILSWDPPQRLFLSVFWDPQGWASRLRSGDWCNAQLHLTRMQGLSVMPPQELQTPSGEHSTLVLWKTV